MPEAKTVVFTATHGVHFADLDIQFTYDRERTGTKSFRVYSVELPADQAKALKALPKEVLKEYGIREDTGDED